MKYFDSIPNRLIFLGENPTRRYWENIWQKHQKNKFSNFDLLVTPTTKKFLPLGSRILEGGCGDGRYVRLLNSAGFKCTGLDFSATTIARIKKTDPQLDLIVGDVRKLKFPKDYFDGYWSLGVIEHFFHGYQPVLSEMKRVLRPGGFLFLTFPYMSPLRRLKAKSNSYPLMLSKQMPSNFYQFALDADQVTANVENFGFKIIQKRPFDGFHGLREELIDLEFLFNPISKLSKKYALFTALRFAVSLAVQSFASHSILLVFKKND